MESTMYSYNSRVGAIRHRCGVLGLSAVALTVMLAAGTLPAHAQVPYDAGTVSRSEQLDVRQSPYYRGYDFYRGTAGQGKYDDGQIHPWHVQGNVWLLAGEPDESNVAVQIGENGALVVNTGSEQMAPKLLAVLNRLTQQFGGDQKNIQWIIDTDSNPNHIGGNSIIRNGGTAIVGSNEQFDNAGLTPGAVVIGSLNMLNRMVVPTGQGQTAVPQGLWPNETHVEPTYSWDNNDEAVTLIHPPSANSDENELVYFRRSDVIATGDVVSMVHYPVIDPKIGGSIDGELSALNNTIEEATADFHMGPQEGGTMIIPGEGRLCDQSDLIEYDIILTTIRNRIMYYKNQGKSLQQVMAMKPTWDFDDRWGRADGSWNAGEFVRAVYNTLPARGKGKVRFAMPEMAGG